MSDMLERCATVGVPTGSRIICGKDSHNTDFDFVMTQRDFYRAFTDAEIDLFEEGDTATSSGKIQKGSGSIRTKLTSTPGFKAFFKEVNVELDIIIVDTIAEKEIWKTTTEICKSINTVYSLNNKEKRITLFEDILKHVRLYS